MNEFDESGNEMSQDTAPESDYTPTEDIGDVSEDVEDTAEDDSQKSVSELYDEGQQQATDAQQEAEDWADENNQDSWGDGTPRANYEMPEDVENTQEGETPNENTDTPPEESGNETGDGRDYQEDSDVPSPPDTYEGTGDPELDRLQSEWGQEDQEYKNAENDIEMSRSQEEANYWEGRADAHWANRDQLGAAGRRSSDTPTVRRRWDRR